MVLNPVRRGVVNDPEGFPWSSYRATAGLGRKSPFLTVDWILGQFGKNRCEAERLCRELVRAGVKEPSSWHKLKGQCLLGGRGFIERISPWLKDTSRLSEIRKRQRLVFRPTFGGDLFGERILWRKEERNVAVATAHLTYGYSLSEIARHLGLHYTTISKIVKRHSKNL